MGMVGGDGVCILAEYNKSRGYNVVIQLDSDPRGTVRLRYQYQQALVLRAGQRVTTGDTVGYEGSTGDSTGSHCHKVCSWLLVVVGTVADDALLGFLVGTLGWQIPFTFMVATLVCVWLLASELLSTIENITDITGSVPPFLAPILNWVKKKAEGTGQQDTDSA